jgi:signal transduction histidine kinase
MLLSSLRNRIFLASVLLAVLAIVVAIYLVNVRVTRAAEAELQRSVVEAGTLVEQHRATLFDTFTVMARLIADLPKLKAAVGTNDPPTVEPIARDYQRQLRSPLFLVANPQGRVLAALGATPAEAEDLLARPGVRAGLQGRETSAFLPFHGGIMQVVTVPIAVGLTQPELLGTLTVGFLLDNALAEQFKQITGSEIAFAMDRQVLASTLPPEWNGELAGLLGSRATSRIRLGANDYVALLRPLGPQAGSDVPTAIVLRSRTQQLQFLEGIHAGLLVTAILVVLLATVLSYAVARTITRPLAAITNTMREVARTGDLTHKIALPHAGHWGDEDARLLASTFNTLTESVARFQREAGERERLSSLGRLSTVIAHEIRNPLMIIKAAVRTLRGTGANSTEQQEAIADIDEEVVRLNRIVNEVLDFARPINFEYAPADLNAICAHAAAGSAADSQEPGVTLRLDPTLPPLVTDAERLRLVLLNLLTNARHAVLAKMQRNVAAGAGAAPPPATPPAITLETSRLAAGGAIIRIADRGVGIDPGDLPRVFEPYFTTKRAGTGLGLAISRHIVEGLGGSLTMQSTPGEGTRIDVRLPSGPPSGGSPWKPHDPPPPGR